MNGFINPNPWLSVIVPVYNAEKNVEKCINSILAQSFSDYELIIIDDGSTDKSSSICRNYMQKDERIRYYFKENDGSLKARIFGIEQLTGDYFTFCDADDYYASKNAFKTMYEEINKNRCDVLQFCYAKKFNHLYSKNTMRLSCFVNFVQYYNNEYPKLLCSHWEEARLTTTVWNKVYKKDLKDHLPSYSSFDRVFWGDDLIMNLYLLEHCKSVSFISDCLYIYRQFSGGTNRFSEKTMSDLNLIKEFQLQFIDHYHGIKKEEIINNCFMEITGWFFFFIRQGLDSVGEERMKLLINESFMLPSFKKAREFYLANPQIENDFISLFKSANAEEYISKAKQENSKKNFKNGCVKFLKQVYKTI